MAALSLDRGRILQVITDLRGSARWLIVYSDSARRIERSRRIDTPVGFVQSLTEPQLLVGFVEKAEEGEIVFFRWNWQEAHIYSRRDP